MVSIIGLIAVTVVAFTIRFNLATKLISTIVNTFTKALVFVIELILVIEFTLVTSIIELV